MGTHVARTLNDVSVAEVVRLAPPTFMLHVGVRWPVEGPARGDQVWAAGEPEGGGGSGPRTQTGDQPV